MIFVKDGTAVAKVCELSFACQKALELTSRPRGQDNIGCSRTVHHRHILR